ncbi:hypothetical protein [Halpernia sp.]|uniref:hypothetical protein n=1 Tax=Halpernia sp. TaxID=2782209 RepID=UPI003A954A18
MKIVRLFYKIETIFLNINCWGNLFYNATTFQVVDNFERKKNENIIVGDFVKIKIPGPPNTSGKGFDWVKVKEMDFSKSKNCETLMIVLQPCSLPTKKTFIAHFYTAESKSYFIIKKYQNKTSAEVHGRNEIPNYKNLPLINKLRNFFIANGGIFGLGKMNWEIWVKNILDKEYLQKC